MGRGYLTVAIRQKMGYPLRGYVPMGIRQPMSANSNISNEKILNTPALIGPQIPIAINRNDGIRYEDFNINTDIAELSTEVFGVFDKNGQPIVLTIDNPDANSHRKRAYLYGNGLDYTVSVPPSILVKMKDNTWTHNHPSGWSSFSLGDLSLTAAVNSAGAEIRHPKKYWNNIEELVNNKKEILSVIRNLEKNPLIPISQDIKNTFKHMEQELIKMEFDVKRPTVVEQMLRKGKWNNDLINITSSENQRKHNLDLLESYYYLSNNVNKNVGHDAISLLISLGATKNYADKYDFNHVVARA
jgi:hypothetical protein